MKIIDFQELWDESLLQNSEELECGEGAEPIYNIISVTLSLYLIALQSDKNLKVFEKDVEDWGRRAPKGLFIIRFADNKLFFRPQNFRIFARGSPQIHHECDFFRKPYLESHSVDIS